MENEVTQETLRSLEFFRDLSAESLEQLAAIATEASYPARRAIFHEHEHAKDVYIITKGKVSLVICAPRVGCRQIAEVGKGDLIGWSPLLRRRRLSDTAWTMVPTTAVVIDGERLLELCKGNPSLGFELMHRTAQVLAERLSATRLQLLNISGQSLPEIALESD